VCKWWWESQDNQNSAIQSLGVSVASYRDAYWPKLDEPHPDIPYFWNGMSHPDTVAHDLISHVVEYALYREFQSQGPSCQIQWETERSCKKALTLIDAEDSSEASLAATPVVVSMVGWAKFEDRPGKPGWISISSNDTSNHLSFQVQIGNTLDVTFLASYNNLHVAYLKIEGCPSEFKLDPIWTKQMSMPTTVGFSRTRLDKYNLVPCMSNNSAITITFRSPIGKFKLLRIVGC